MRDEVRNFLVKNHSNSDVEQDELDWDLLNDDDVDDSISTIPTANSFERLTITY